MHRSGDIKIGDVVGKFSISWPNVLSAEEWLAKQPVQTVKERFEQNGYMFLDSVVGETELKLYQDLYDRMLSGEIDTSAHRHDLGNAEARKTESENICQIMWPSVYVNGLEQGPIHQRCLAIAKALLGDDIIMDFDMLITKMPFTNTPTPWHQDESYWPDMPDKRAVSFWVAMDEVFLDNGCMWFGKKRVASVLPHRPVREGVHVLTCDGTEDEGVAVPLKPGGATLHQGLTLHYSRGNSTDKMRRAFIVNYRPKEMVEFERHRGFDHGKEGVHGVIGKGHTHDSK